MADDKKKQTIPIPIDEDTAQGKYANLTIVSHTENEFVLDYAFIQPPQGNAKVHSRIIINPKQAKKLAVILSNSVVQFEEKYGAIDIGGVADKNIH